jgi:hypothetical protein
MPRAGPDKVCPTAMLISIDGGFVLTYLLWTKRNATSAAANGEEGASTGWNGNQRVMNCTPVHVTLSSPIETASGPFRRHGHHAATAAPLRRMPT